MYADDTTIYFNLEDFSRDDVVNCVSIELNKVNNWLYENKLTLNIEKNYDFFIDIKKRLNQCLSR